MRILMPPEPSATLGPDHEEVKEFARKYGKNGYLLRVSDQWICPVKQLDFRLHDYAGECTAIPEEERTSYNKALTESGLMVNVVPRGAQYSLPLDGWFAPDHDEYASMKEHMTCLGYI